MEVRLLQISFWRTPYRTEGLKDGQVCGGPLASFLRLSYFITYNSLKAFAIFRLNLSEIDELWSWCFNPLSPNSVQDQSSPYNYPYTVKR